MGLMITFRSLLAGRRRGLARVLVIATLVFGVVLVHTMSGATTPGSTPVVAVADHHIGAGAGRTAAQAQVGASAVEQSAVQDKSGCSHECGDHHDAATLCLMVLAALLSLVVPRRAVLMRLAPAWAFAARWALPGVQFGTAPSLHALGISRT